MVIGQKIKLLRMEKGITQETLAKRLCVTPQAVSKWETGSAVPDISMLVPLADFFGKTADFLLREESGRKSFDMSDLEFAELGRWKTPSSRFVRYTVKNVSDIPFGSIKLKFLFKNASGEVIDYCHEYIGDLEPGHSCPLRVSSRAAEKFSNIEIKVTDYSIAIE